MNLFAQLPQHARDGTYLLPAHASGHKYGALQAAPRFAEGHEFQ